MPTPITISISPALRSGSFSTAVLDYPGGYSFLNWSLTGMGTGPDSDYENPDNGFTALLYLSIDDGVTYTSFTGAGWRGGPFTDKQGILDPPPILQSPLDGLPANSKVFIQVDLTGTFTIGIDASIT
jgi:hypothetical protein